jgi:hypothetical protein
MRNERRGGYPAVLVGLSPTTAPEIGRSRESLVIIDDDIV